MWHLLPIETEILSRRSAIDCSRLTRFWSASASAFLDFLALVFADLAALLAKTLAALALSQAYLEVFSSASRADMRAWAMVKVTKTQKKDAEDN
jgi:hypothetical protein